MTPELRKFLDRWLKWAEGGAKTPEFDRSYGLCYNAPFEAREDLKTLIHKEFPDEPNYPFGGIHTYFKQMGARAQHRNIDRLAWVRRKLGEEA